MPINKTKTREKKETYNKGGASLWLIVAIGNGKGKMKENYFVMLPKYNEGYSNEEMFLLALAQGLENKLGYASLTFGELINYCGVTKASQDVILEALQSLEQKQHFKVKLEGRTKNANVLIADITPKLDGEKGHIQIYAWEFYKFLKEVSKSKIIPMFNHFAFIIDFINMGKDYRKIAFPSLKSICETIGKTDRTVRSYNEELEKLKLMYSKNLVVDHETIKKVYSRFNDKQDVDEAIEEALSNGTKHISIKRPVVKVENSNTQSKQQSSSNTNSEALNRVMKRVERIGLDFNKALSTKINNVISQLQNSKADAVEVVVHLIQKTFREAANVTINSKNAFLMKVLQDEKNIKKAEDYVLRQIAVNERPVKTEPLRDHTADYAEMVKRQEVKQPKKEEIQNLSFIFSSPELDWLNKDEWTT